MNNIIVNKYENGKTDYWCNADFINLRKYEKYRYEYIDGQFVET